MLDFLVVKGQTQVLVPLRIKPNETSVPSVTGSPFSDEAGTVMHGYYNMEYLLPGGDTLRIVANHNKKPAQLLLFTHNTELLKQLPGTRPTSLVANTISIMQRYVIRSSSYSQPLSTPQQQKVDLTHQCLRTLQPLLKREQALRSDDHSGHEALRREILASIEHTREGNRLIAVDPTVSEGMLGSILYEAHKCAQHFQFNRVFPVSAQDQMDFSDPLTHNGKVNPCFIWDSEIHVGNKKKDLEDAIRVISQAYNLTPATTLNNIPANRLARLEAFFLKLWRDGKDWINFLAIPNKPQQQTETEQRPDGIAITKVTPYYQLQGVRQQGHPQLKELIKQFSHSDLEHIAGSDLHTVVQRLEGLPNGNWALLDKENRVIVRLADKLISLRFFIQDGLFYPLPEGQDIYTLSRLSRRHLYLPERVSLKFEAFISRVPTFFQSFYASLSRFIIHDLHDDFFTHVHASHLPPKVEPIVVAPKVPDLPIKSTLHNILVHHGLLQTGQTLEEFIAEQLTKSPFVIARANHQPSPPTYENPFHRVLSVIRHIGNFFVDTSEANPLIGTMGMAAYLYGAGAVLAPEFLESVLTKLHASGLIAGIESVQKLGHWISHGHISEAISASVTMWQGVVAGSNLDKFFVEALSILKEDPAEVAIIVSLALTLGYSITKIIPSLQHEMGEFPIPNYAALGGKGGAAIYDTIMHPGDDWLLGTCKWFCRGIITLGKLTVAPLIEAYHYGFHDGLVHGLRKNGLLALRLSKQILAASGDFVLSLLTLPLLEVSAMAVHVPFWGLTNLITKLLGILGNIHSLGLALIDFAQRPTANNFLSEFRLSPLYGFTSPFGQFATNPVANILINAARVVCIPVLQTIKNIVILPVIDSLALTVRIALSVINPTTRLAAYGLGSLIYNTGYIWDYSLGPLFTSTASWLILFCNQLDKNASAAKQYLLSQIEIQRADLYHWAFAEEDRLLHSTLEDPEYYSTNPLRLEKIPHTNSYCLLSTLLTEGPSRATDPIAPASSASLFNPAVSAAPYHHACNTKTM